MSDCRKQIVKPEVDESFTPGPLCNSGTIIMDIEIPYFGINVGDSLNTALEKIAKTVSHL